MNIFKKYENQNLEIEKLKEEYKQSVEKLGKKHKKTVFIQKRIDTAVAQENFFSKVGKQSYYEIMDKLPSNFEHCVSSSNVVKAFDEYGNLINSISNILFDKDYTTNEVVSATTLFMYLIDVDYTKNKFSNDLINEFMDTVLFSSTGEATILIGIDNRAGFSAFFSQLLNRGFDNTVELEYAEEYTYNGKNCVEVVTCNDPLVIPYHIYQYNLKNLDKMLNDDDYKLSNIDYYADFAEKIENTKKKTVEAVIKVLKLENLFKEYKLNTFLNDITMKNFHNLCQKYIDKSFSDFENPILFINGRYLSAKKLLELVLLYNEVDYYVVKDLLAEDNYYLKIKFDEDTVVKYNIGCMFDENYEINDIHSYISDNAFKNEKVEDEDTENFDIDTKNLDEDIESLDEDIESLDSTLTHELTEKMPSDFVPNSAYEVLLQMAERKSKNAVPSTDVEYTDSIDESELINTKKVNQALAQKEKEQLEKDTQTFFNDEDGGVEDEDIDIDNEYQIVESEKIDNDEIEKDLDKLYDEMKSDFEFEDDEQDEIYNDDFSAQMSTFLTSKSKEEPTSETNLQENEETKNENSNAINDKEYVVLYSDSNAIIENENRVKKVDVSSLTFRKLTPSKKQETQNDTVDNVQVPISQQLITNAQVLNAIDNAKKQVLSKDGQMYDDGKLRIDTLIINNYDNKTKRKATRKRTTTRSKKQKTAILYPNQNVVNKTEQHKKVNFYTKPNHKDNSYNFVKYRNLNLFTNTHRSAGVPKIPPRKKKVVASNAPIISEKANQIKSAPKIPSRKRRD